jgi:oligopeptide transport system permease protein
VIALLLRRLFLFVPVAAIFAVLSFASIRALPGGPFDAERALPPAIEAALRQRYRLDAPLAIQAADYVAGLLRFDFGPSMRYRNRSVGAILAEAAPASLGLGALAIAVALVMGPLLGVGSIVAGERTGRAAFSVLSGAGLALPSFVLGPLLVIVFSYGAGLFPAVGHGTPRHFVLPVAALALAPSLGLARLVRTGLIETLRENFVRTAVAKGCRRETVILRHALPHAVPAAVAYLGPAAAGVLTGSFAVEAIFALPGLGAHFVHGVLARDYTLVNGCALLYFTLLYALSAVADAIAERVDPRSARG